MLHSYQFINHQSFNPIWSELVIASYNVEDFPLKLRIKEVDMYENVGMPDSQGVYIEK